jgi:hypothetical protein
MPPKANDRSDKNPRLKLKLRKEIIRNLTPDLLKKVVGAENDPPPKCDETASQASG